MRYQLISAILLLTLSNFLQAQKPGHVQTNYAIAWQKCLGGERNESAIDLIRTQDSGYVLLATAESSDGDLSANKANTSMWVMKLDPTGRTVWQKFFSSETFGFARSIVQTKDGGFVIGGNLLSLTASPGIKALFLAGSLTKLSADGDVQWRKTYGSNGTTTIESLRQTQEGGYVLFCSSSAFSNDTSGKVHLQSPDYCVIKTDSKGEVEWRRSYGGSREEGAVELRETADGGYILGGYSNSYDGDVDGYHRSLSDYTDFWIVKIDSKGSIQWKKILGGSGTEMPRALVQTADGGYLVGGQTTSIDGDLKGPTGRYGDDWLVKLSADGQIQWQKKLDQGQLNHIEQEPDGGFIVCSSKYIIDLTRMSGDPAYAFPFIWIAKLDEKGNEIWHDFYGGNQGAYPKTVKRLPNGHYIVLGAVGASGKDVIGYHGKFDVWLFELERK